MKTSKSLAVLMLLAGTAPTSALASGAWEFSWMVSAEAIAQASKSKPASDRQEVDGLLARARQAIKEGNLETADSLITRAEKTKVEYGLFHLGDTPKKLRSELLAAQKAAKKDAPARPSQKYTPELPAKTAEPAPVPSEMPRASKPVKTPVEVSDPDQDASVMVPQHDERIKPVVPPRREATIPDDEIPISPRLNDPNLDRPLTPGSFDADARRQSDTHLLTARRALAVGDVRRASASVEAARQLNVAYSPQDDTPQRVDGAIRNYRQVTENGTPTSDVGRRQLADLLMEQAQHLIRWQEYEVAEQLARNVQNLRVNYGPYDSRPESLLEKIAAAKGQPARELPRPRGPASTIRELPGAPVSVTEPDSEMVYPIARHAERDAEPSPNRAAAPPVRRVAVADDLEPQSSAPLERHPLPSGEPRPIPTANSAMQLFQQGEQALRSGNRAQAQVLFRQAHALRDQLEPSVAERLQDHLQMLAGPAGGVQPIERPAPLLEDAASKQQVILKQLMTEVAEKQVAAQKVQKADPTRSAELLKQARAAIEAAPIDSENRSRLMRRVDRSVEELDKYVHENRAQIELDAANKAVLKEVDRRQQMQIKIDEELAVLVDKYNKLMDEQRFAEAEVLAKRARELKPDDPVVKQLIWQNNFLTRTQRNRNLIDDKERAVWQAFDSVEESAIPVDDREPYQMPNPKKWEELTKNRKRLAQTRRRSERELEIERKLKTPVSCQFKNYPLREALNHLASLADINLYIDPKGLDEEGVSPDATVDLDLKQEISLKSALQIILPGFHLSYVIKDEVLKITSEQLKDGELVVETYDVADLVIGIPNFSPNGRVGLAGALSDGYSISGAAGMGAGMGGAFASAQGTPGSSMIQPAGVLAQSPQWVTGGMSRSGARDGHAPIGPGGVGGGVQPDYDKLIDLVTSTIKPSTWDEVGGPGTITPFPHNLSLVISQTQDVHDEIVELLEQLRRNQDLQVTIEVRFITLNDNFFERIGVDFQAFVINNAPRDPRGPGGVGVAAGNLQEIVGIDTVGGNAPAVPFFTPNLEIPFRQSSFNLATPQFGQPVEVAHFGFAILSDIEAFFLVNAAQGDRRSNVLQAPKVTLFNGQQAAVSDQTQTPFVTSVVPVVGDFAAAYQPVIVVLNEGTYLSVQAVVSNDHRFVRLTVVPFFSQIGDVKEFTFSGSTTTTKKSSDSNSKGGASGDSSSSSDDATTTSEGITIQLPNFSFVTVTTTVSVPDGGTVLLGGIKRLSEGRNEFGVPILSKLPYINRLFKNVGIGRETQSLMMMVTPRIIIQEEEEARLGIELPQ